MIYRYRQTTCFPYALPPYGPGKPRPIDVCSGMGRPAPTVLSSCCTGIPLRPVINIVTVFNNEAREREAQDFCSWFAKVKTQKFSLSQILPAGVLSLPVQTGLSPHSLQPQLRFHKKNASKLRTALECISSRATTI